MLIRINEDKFKKEYRFDKNEVMHSSGKNIKLLPYKTKYEKKYEEQIENFNTCIGEFSRLLYDKKITNAEINLKNIDIFTNVVEANPNDKLVLNSIIKEFFFDRNEHINLFHPILFNYISSSKNDWNISLAEFLYDVLLNNDEEAIIIKNKVKKIFDTKSDNVLELLILNNLPSLSKYSKQQYTYKCICENVSKLFKEDLNFILDNKELFKSEFDNLLKYYYFFYVSQFTLKMSKFFDTKRDNIEKVYFNLDWESVSKSRMSYMFGWKIIESNIYKLFSHINTLEILNINDMENKYDYIDLNDIIDNLQKHEKSILYQNIINIKNIYTNSIKDVNWDLYITKNKYENNIKQDIYDLFNKIDYQFIKSGRKKPYTDYTKWFQEYCKLNFLKRRGSIGYTLNITQDKLLFITKLCIKHKDKIKLKDLFYEYERRGIYFDRDSQLKVVELFDKLNIIEKKSDSGDAQYVRSIL